jgi:Rps23 Pro-64 3,4-dihydroxylase Tpa1-like proline 4-hydroxylase
MLEKTREIQDLIQQLDLIQHIAQARYWLNTEEICSLLNFDRLMLPILQEKELGFSFVWRNFVITYISQQGNSQCWQLQAQSALDISQANISKTNISQANISKTNISQANISKTNISQANTSKTNISQANTSQPSTTSIPNLATPQVELPSPILPSTCLQIEEFLDPKLWQKIYKYALGREKDFIPTSTSTDASDYRRSLFLPYFPEFFDLMVGKVREIMPEVQKHLNLDNFEIENIEAQLTTHNDGNFYKIHNDNGSSDTVNRELTYVYYFYREPKPFSGGELVIYDSKIENNFYVAAETKQAIQPLNNSIVFFLSRYMHEVLPVSCPTQSFVDGRFTVNGWVRRKK